MAQMPTSARPTMRPASAVTRRAPGSSAASSATTSAMVVSRPRVCVKAEVIARRPTTVSRQPPVAAPADVPAVDHGDVPEFAGRSGGPLVRPAAEDQPGADAVGQHHIDEIIDALTGAEGPFGECAEVRVVAHVDRQPDALAQARGDVDAAVPSRSARTGHAGCATATASGPRPRRPRRRRGRRRAPRPRPGRARCRRCRRARRPADGRRRSPRCRSPSTPPDRSVNRTRMPRHGGGGRRGRRRPPG